MHQYALSALESNYGDAALIDLECGGRPECRIVEERPDAFQTIASCASDNRSP